MEADYFWEKRAANPAFPLPDTRNLSGFLAPVDDDRALPENLRDRSDGFHSVPSQAGLTTVYITTRNDQRLYLLFDSERVNELATYFGLAPLIVVLLVLYLSVWLAFRASQRAISPVTWLAREVNRLDPQAPVVQRFDPSRLPPDADEEVRVLAAALTGGPPLDVLIHNAGISAVGPFVDSDLAAQQAVLSVNLEAPLVLTAAILQRAHLSAHGTIVFLSSLSHFVSYPGAAVYAASKDGLAAYARSVAVALSPAGIHVLSVFPGPTRTAHARRYSPDNRREARRMAPDLLASQIFNAIRLRRKRLIPGWGARLAAIGAQVAPRIFEALMRRAIFDKIRGAPQSKV